MDSWDIPLKRIKEIHKTKTKKRAKRQALKAQNAGKKLT
jgi:hypothetical protein